MKKSDENSWKQGGPCRFDKIIPSPDGSIKTFDVIKVPIFHSDGRRKGLIVFGRDITDQKIFQDKLQKAEKMQATELMADGVAHDLNNILSVLEFWPIQFSLYSYLRIVN